VMARLTMTPAIVRALKELQDLNQLPDVIGNASEPPLDEPAVGHPISHGQIIAVSKKLTQVTGVSYQHGSEIAMSSHLDDLLRGSRVYIERPKPKAEPVATPSFRSSRSANHQ
jgi:hypothetical protein